MLTTAIIAVTKHTTASSPAAIVSVENSEYMVSSIQPAPRGK